MLGLKSKRKRTAVRAGPVSIRRLNLLVKLEPITRRLCWILGARQLFRALSTHQYTAWNIQQRKRTHRLEAQPVLVDRTLRPIRTTGIIGGQVHPFMLAVGILADEEAPTCDVGSGNVRRGHAGLFGRKGGVREKQNRGNPRLIKDRRC